MPGSETSQKAGTAVEWGESPSEVKTGITMPHIIRHGRDLHCKGPVVRCVAFQRHYP